MIYWGKGNGKKLVASIMVMVMLITQSVFLTSSADVIDDTPADAGVTQTPEDGSDTDNVDDGVNLLADVTDNISDRTITYYRVDESGNIYQVHALTPVVSNGDGTYSIYQPDAATLAGWVFGTDNAGQSAYVDFSGLYLDRDCTQSASGNIQDDWAAENGIYKVYFKATRLSYPLEIINPKDSSVKTTTIPVTTQVDGNIYPSVTYIVQDATVYGFYMVGYKFAGLKYGAASYAPGQTVTVEAGAQVNKISMSAEWTAMSANVSFNAKGADAPSDITLTSGTDFVRNIEYIYGSTAMLPTADEIWATSDAYELTGWKYGDTVYSITGEVDTTSLFLAKTDLAYNPNIEGKELTAVWSYKNTDIIATDDGTVTSDGIILIEGEYGDEIFTKIRALYSDGTDSPFKYEITTADIAKLGNYGLGVQDAGDHYEITGCLNSVTPDDGITVSLLVTDEKLDDDPSTDVDERVKTYVVKIVSNKKTVTIDPSSIKDSSGTTSPYKYYDGNNKISVNTRVELQGIAEFNGVKDNVYITVNPIALLEDASGSAGTEKNIILYDVQFTGDADKLNNYVLSGVSEANNITVNKVATVHQKPLNIGIKLKDGEDDTVLFGEASPEYVLYLENPDDLIVASEIEAYNSLTSDEARNYFVIDKLGSVTYTSTRSIYSPVGTYTIFPEFNSTDKNYVAVNGVSSSFSVTRENGIQYTESTISTANFKLSSEKASNGYYPGLTITPYGENYNKIRLLDSSSSDITSDMSKQEAEALFGSSITLPDMTDGTVSFQLLNTKTGAITNIVTLTNVNIDTTGPTLERYTMSPNVTYFNELPFGSYFHSQVIDGNKVESISITFEYITEGSECEYLYYSFVDENGDVIGNNSNQVKLVKDELKGNYKANINIGTGEFGQLVVYAVDTTGNSSILNKIKLHEYEEYLKENQGSNNYYEWMVENTIESSVIEAYNGNAHAVSGVWYNDLNVKVEAGDVDSGVNSIKWTIKTPNGTTVVTENAGDIFANVSNMTSYGKILEYTFEQTFNDESLTPGEYSFSATLKDNAGNTVELDEVGPFLVDTKAPVIKDNTKYTGDTYTDGVQLSFNVSEGEDESGLASVTLYKKKNGELTQVKSWNIQDEYTYDIFENGTYVIEAVDNAGNVTTYETSFKLISKVAPADPIISIDGTVGNDNWYIKESPEVTITYATETSDGVPVETYYKIITENSEKEYVLSDANNIFTLSNQGEVTIEAWSVSESGCTSNVISKTINADKDAPDIQIFESSVDDDGILTINFKIYDTVSGVNLDKVCINGKSVEVVEEDGVITGSFVVSENETYEITAEDYAGNVSDTVEFEPLGLVVNPITNITSSGADLEAFVYEGTYEIMDAYISYKKDGDSSYKKALYNKSEENYGLYMNVQFEHLEEDTVYWYKVYAKSKTSNEIKVIEGSFKTLDDSATGMVTGTATYGEDVKENYPIYVSLYEANTVVSTKVIESEEDSTYLFENISDGAYRIVATDGELTKTAAVTVENGGITYPTNYAENGGINFVLNAMNTEVVIKDNAINITADGLEQIYDTTWYEGTITPEDKSVLEEGGSITVSLHASYINVTDLSPDEKSILNNKLGDNSVIEKYIQLYIVKEVKDKDGKYVNGTPVYVPELYDPITISFPLGDLAGQKIYVASVHGDGSDYSFINWNNASDVTLSENFVTISTKYFSVYALYRTVEAPKEYTVKWIDGDGKVMKTETVVEGESATPPTDIPTKKASAKYTYTFSGWDTDYSSITKDTIIAAWFTATEIDNSGSDNTTEEPKAPDATVTPGDNNTNDNTTNNDTSNNTTENNNGGYTYMGSAGSPNTGDETPLLILLMMMVISASGVVFLKKMNK